MPKNATISLPDDLAAAMARFPQIKWPEVMRQALRQEIDRLSLLDEAFAESTLTEEDIVRIGRDIRRASARKTRSKVEAVAAARGREGRRAATSPKRSRGQG